MQSRGGQKIQGARKIHTAEKKDLQQAKSSRIFNSFFLSALIVQAKAQIYK